MCAEISNTLQLSKYLHLYTLLKSLTATSYKLYLRIQIHFPPLEAIKNETEFIHNAKTSTNTIYSTIFLCSTHDNLVFLIMLLCIYFFRVLFLVEVSILTNLTTKHCTNNGTFNHCLYV